MPIINDLLIFSPTLQDALIDKNGLPLAAGIITCYADNSRTTLKNWYYQTGTPGSYNYLPLPNPMRLSAAGTIQDVNGVDVIPGFYPYSELDSTVNEPYYITVDNANGQRQFTRANFPFVAGSGITPAITSTLQNYVINNVFWRNIGSKDLTTLSNSTPYFYAPLTIYYETLAPSQHDGFMIPDFTYCKDGNGSIESVSFDKFSNSTEATLTGDVTPEYFCKFICTAPGSETLKFFMFPIALHVRNLAFSPFIATIQARIANNVNTALTLSLYQSTGTGGDLGGELITEVFTLGSNWNQFDLRGVFPPLTVNTGVGGDDGYYLLIGFPASQALSVEFAMPSLYLGNEPATNSFQTYDMVDSIANTPRTGDIRTSINNFYPFGWVPMNDGTVGFSSDNPSFSKATARNNADTWPLYNLLWQYAKPFDVGGGANTNPVCQLYTNAIPPVAIDYGTTAYGDFSTGKLLALTPMFGKVLAGNVPIDALLPDVYSQTFTASNVNETFTVTINTSTVTVPLITGLQNGMLITVSTMGTLPAPLLINTPYYIKNIVGNTFNLSTTQDGDLITFTTTGVGVHSLNTALVINVQAGTSYYIGEPVTVTSEGTLPGNLQENKIYYVANIAANTIALATTYQNALTGFPIINYVDQGSANIHTIFCQVSGISVGEYFHRLSIGEMPIHNHLATPSFFASSGAGRLQTGGVDAATGGVTPTILNNGGDKPHLNMQPSTYYNVYIKL